MDRKLRKIADEIVQSAIAAVLPDAAVRRALEAVRFPGKVILVAVGKAAWQMASAAYSCLGRGICDGIIITKYGHCMGPIGNLRCMEAGHPVPDENSFAATRAALDMVSGLKEEDTVLFLLSGGGSALFEDPLIPPQELQDITGQLLGCGADIMQINTIRKRLSGVKGGRFARHCAPAQVYSVVLSDIIGDPLDMIASGPTFPDSSTCVDALKIVEKYRLRLSGDAMDCLRKETPKELPNATGIVTGSVRELCTAAVKAASKLGYAPMVLTDQLCCQAREAGSFLSSIARTYYDCGKRLAFIAGGETVVKLTGTGKGGRNQELALAAAPGIDGLPNVCLFSIGSDGTDGPTDAAGGYVDTDTAGQLRAAGLDIHTVLENNDSYHALKSVDGLIITGPTGTNVNDVAVLLMGT
jgi:hydroxypyruvate reductase